MNIKLAAATLACSLLFSPVHANEPAVDVPEDKLTVHMKNVYGGQLAESRGDFDTARTLYEKAADQYEDLDAQEMADNALLLLSFMDVETAPKHVLANRSFAYLTGKAKSVDGLVDPDDNTGINAADAAFEIMLAGNLNLWSTDDARFSVGANLFREDYVDYSDFDLQLLGVSAQLDKVLGQNLLKLQLGYSNVQLGGDDYLSYADITISDTIILSDSWNLKVSAMLRDISSDNAEYSHYAGDAVKVGIEFKGREDNPWRVDYAWQSSDAADDYVELSNEDGDIFDGFLSCSRSYHRFRMHYDHAWNDRLSQTFTASLRTTEYDDPNRFLEYADDATLTEILRKGTRYSIGSEVSWSASDRLRVIGDIEFYDENSNIDQYDFDSLQIGIGVDFFF